MCSFYKEKTRPDTQQDSHGRLGRGRHAKTAQNSEIFVTDVLTDTARCRVACARPIKVSLHIHVVTCRHSAEKECEGAALVNSPLSLVFLLANYAMLNCCCHLRLEEFERC